MTASIDTLKTQLAVIAVGVDFPGCQNLNTFYKAIYAGADLTQPVEGWKPFGCVKRAAQSALQAAGNLEVGLLAVGPAGELSRVRPLINGAILEYSGSAEPLPAMLMQAHAWLEAQLVQAVLISGGCVSASAGTLPPVFGFGVGEEGLRPGSGAVAVLVTRLNDAQQRGQRVLAVIDAMAFQNAPEPSGQAVQSCIAAALGARGVLPAQVDYVECLASGQAVLDHAEIAGLCAIYRGAKPTTLMGSLRAQTGWLEGVNGLASLARVTICLAYQIRPGTRGWAGPKAPAQWLGSAFYVLPESLTWFRPVGEVGRRAGVNLLVRDGSCGHILLTETEVLQPAEVVMRDLGQQLLMAGGATAADIGREMETLKKRLEDGEAFDGVARQAYAQFQQTKPAEMAVFLARNSTEAVRELDFGLRGLFAAAEKGSEWQTPAGSYYTPRPLGAGSQVAFVYPGAFNSYLGAGKDLFALFPGLQNRLAQIAPAGSVLYEEMLYPRSLAPLVKEESDRLEAALLDNAFAMMSSGLSLSVIQTMIFRDIFHLQPHSALGYSLGENSMLFAMGVWGDGVNMSQRLHTSPLFQTRLAGPQNAVREYWGLPVQTLVSGEQELWGNFLLMAPVERVEQALAAEPRVYLTHINTPRQVVIAGDPAACRRVIEGLKCSSLRAPFNYVLHCKAMESEYQALYDLHSWPVKEQPTAQLYSAADNQPFQWSEAEVARAVARDLCSRLDFPRLVETVYAGGARIFIELGAGSNCSKWIEDSLRGRPFLAVSANRKGVEDASAILRVLARLASHQVAVNLDPLFGI